MNGIISFNSNSLQTYSSATKTGIITNAIQHTNIPDQVAELLAKADANGSYIPSLNYPSKKIQIAGAIAGSSQDDLDARIDTFKGYFIGKDKNLDIQYAGGTRRYIATVNSSSVDRDNVSLYATFTIEFICSQPFGLDTATTSLMNQTGYTSASYNVTPTIGGSAPSQLPIFTITVTALTGVGDYVQISNDLNNQAILVYGLGITAGSVIEIDCVARTVKLNGVEVNYSGTFLDLAPGASSITYSDGFDTRTVTIVATYAKRWM